MFNIKRPISETENAYRELESIDFISGNAFDQFKKQTNMAYNIFWNGKSSPTMKAQLLGPKLIEVFKKSAISQAFIKSIETDYEEKGIPEGWKVEWAQDGSGKITK